MIKFIKTGLLFIERNWFKIAILLILVWILTNPPEITILHKGVIKANINGNVDHSGCIQMEKCESSAFGKSCKCHRIPLSF